MWGSRWGGSGGNAAATSHVYPKTKLELYIYICWPSRLLRALPKVLVAQQPVEDLRQHATQHRRRPVSEVAIRRDAPPERIHVS